MLTVGTPVVFTQFNQPLYIDVMGGLISGTTYYIKDIISSYQFTVSETLDGTVYLLQDSTTVTAGSFVVGTEYSIVTLGTTDWNLAAGTIGITYNIGSTFTAANIGNGDGTVSSIFVNTTEWIQDNVDRIYVTVNGYRVPSSSIKINPQNDLSLLIPITNTDNITITSMIPSATPNSETFAINVNKFDIPSVYRIGSHTLTWITEPLYDISETIQVNDARSLVNIIVQEEIAPAPVDDIITIGLDADKRIITNIQIYNETTETLLSSNDFSYSIVDVSPVVNITNNVSEGDIVIITTTEGAFVYISGEQIKFTNIDLETNTLSGLQRGVNGTGVISYSPEYTPILSILSKNKLPDSYYNVTWNPIDQAVYNTTKGDPLQISVTNPANFLNQDQY